MNEELSQTEIELLKRAVKGVVVFIVIFLLARNVTQTELPTFQISMAVGLMSMLHSTRLIVNGCLILLMLEVLFPAALAASLLNQIKNILL